MSVTTEQEVMKILKTMTKPEYCATFNTSCICHKLTWQYHLFNFCMHLTLVCERLTRNKNDSDNNAKQWKTEAWKAMQKQVHFPRVSESF